VTAECLWCHAGKPLPVAKTLNKYQQPAFAEEAISCDRCHGPVAEHVNRPSKTNIINPKRLGPRARDSICEQCHLSGEVRIANPGKQIGDFNPGQELEEVFSVYVFERAAESGLKVISHVQQLAQSACHAKSGGKLSCTTCHDPHDKPANPVAHYRTRCLTCHPGVEKIHSVAASDCVQCHMPSRRAKDGGHTAFTDHQIQRKTTRRDGSPPSASKLVAWRDPPQNVSSRNLALAYLTVGERDRSAFHMDEAARLLIDAESTHAADPAVLTGLGLLALRQQRPAEALPLFERALKAEPSYAPYQVNFATALNAAGRTDEAVAWLRKAIAQDPSLEPAYRRLGEIMRQRRRPDELRAVFESYLKFMPNNVTAKIALQSQ
jgi:tetratricopeptide (TPR) repeat protein